MKFVKMHGLGNDFALVDAMDAPYRPEAEHVRALADRRRGIGFDQMLLLERPRDGKTVCSYRVFNADGTEAQHCGNGMRCIGLYLQRRRGSGDGPFRVGGPGGAVTITLDGPQRITVDMGEPEFEPERIPFRAERAEVQYRLEVDGSGMSISALSMGNPHAVLVVPDVDAAEVSRLGPAIERHVRFPEHTNVGFMQILDRGRVRLRVHERGVGETRACGSGACAAVVAGRRLERLDERVRVRLPGGVLVIEWDRMSAPVRMTGPAAWVYEGNIEP